MAMGQYLERHFLFNKEYSNQQLNSRTQPKFHNTHSATENILKLECWQLTCQFPTCRSPVLCSFDRDNLMYEQQT